MSDSLHPPLAPAELAALTLALRELLSALPPEQPLPTYHEVARALHLKPPHTVYREIQALEHSMRQDAAAGRPLIAARVVSRVRDRLPAPGFFDLATRLGLHAGAESGPAARAFHQAQLQALARAG